MSGKSLETKMICGPTSPAAAGVVLVQVVLQRVPAAAHPHHHVGAQNLNSGHVKHPRITGLLGSGHS